MCFMGNGNGNLSAYHNPARISKLHYPKLDRSINLWVCDLIDCPFTETIIEDDRVIACERVRGEGA